MTTARQPLPPTMRETISFREPEELREKLDRQLRLMGCTLRHVKRLHIAWPHKHPDRDDNPYTGAEVERVCDALKKTCPHTSIARARGLYETIHLGRSEDHSTLHALTGRQIYATDPALQENNEPLPFTTPGASDYFVLVDWAMEQGTTIANLASHLIHRGGHIIAAIVPDYGGAPLAQNERCDHASLSRHFHDAALRHGQQYSPEQCLALFDAALARHGRNLKTLTYGEFTRLNSGACLSYFPLLDSLGMDEPARRAFIDRHSPGLHP